MKIQIIANAGKRQKERSEQGTKRKETDGLI